jgi:hypothetical protein
MKSGSCTLRDSNRRLWLVREVNVPPESAPSPYESEGSARVSRGSITLSNGACWLARVEVAIDGDNSALLTLHRQASEPSLAPDEASLVIPPGEAQTVLTLLQGLFAQARRDGVLSG